jgi:hypothetical protein
MAANQYPAKMSVYAEDGAVFAQLPEFHLQLTPDQARKWATALFIKANEAEGLEAPQLVMLNSN